MQTLAPAIVKHMRSNATAGPRPDDHDIVCFRARLYLCHGFHSTPASPLLLHTHTCDTSASLFHIRALAKLLFYSICELACC